MFGDLRELPDRGMDCDILIIGSGAAGISLASQLHDGRRRIVLAEAGGLRVAESAQSLFAARQLGEPFAAGEGRFRVFGGTTTAWTGRCAPLDPLDFARREWVPHSGWPVLPDAFARWYPQAAAMCGFQSGWDESPPSLERIRALPDRPDDLAPFVWRFWGTGRDSYQNWGEHFHLSFRRSRSLHVVLQANLVGLTPSPDGRRVTAATLSAPDGRRATVRPRQVVLCCGGIENARLLLNVAEDDPSLLGEVKPVLGRYFMQHPRAVTARIAMNGEQSRQLQQLFNRFKRNRGPQYESGLCLSETGQRRHRLLNASAVLRYPGSGPSFPIPRQIRDLDRALTSTVRRLRGHEPLLGAGTASLVIDLEQTPDPESRIVLDASRDALGLRSAAIDWRIGKDERRTGHLFTQRICDWIDRAGLGASSKIEGLEEDGGLRTGEMHESYHHLGATRMSETAATGVVDASLRVHGTDNFYLCGGSVMPTGGHANPTLTIVALALRLGEMLQAI
ncbi:GMC oxidoreductase [Sphingomonas sp. S2-65]|uniref:GMC oxidoreductase n=1 Tax=Sphingomonas sp. S2-65 TaxID=2903960 RepID=UPI001F244C30|nr:GMC oxidoreductase [Sphingomonas sp. S2-65]UYY57062.1 GMC oxidoreductase [Sphingomonas sp. S2-65]